MSLLEQTLVISASMAFLCGLPMLSTRIRGNSRFFYLVGTGALFGICVFDLLPDVFELGGRSSLMIMGAVWAAYSLIHLLHLGQHRHEAGGPSRGGYGGHSNRGQSSVVFLGSMMAHCFASGMLLAVSNDLPGRVAWTVFLALLAHKVYESLTVSSLLIERHGGARLAAAWAVVGYALSLPAGVVVTFLFRGMITQGVALTITSIAAGTLFGCLIFDFLLPSVYLMRQRAWNAGWVAMGLLMTQIVLRNL